MPLPICIIVNNETLCKYQCGQEGKFILKNGSFCCSSSSNQCPVIRDKNRNGLKNAYKSGIKKPFSLIYESLSDDVKSRMNWSIGKNSLNDNRIRIVYSEQDIFCKNSKVSRHVVKRYLKSEANYLHKCKQCGLSEWLGQKIVLELEHVNGDRRDHSRENLKWLCPNCHSLTPTWRGRNIKKNHVDEKTIIELIPTKENISQVLIDLGLAPYGANYNRINKLINKHNLSFITKPIKSEKPKIIFNADWRHNPRPHTRKVIRPSKEDLEKLVNNFPITKIGEQFGVSDNAVRKWCKCYKIGGREAS